MNRTLRRPMFRTGGTAEGITSGLSRQGYAHEPGHVKPEDPAKSNGAWNQFLGKIPEIQAAAKTASYKPRGTNVYDFMTEFGLDLATRPKSGSIFQQMAASAKDPYAKFMERKKSAAEQEYGSESDMFKTMLGVYGDIAGGEGAGESAKLLDKENTARLIGEWITNIDSNTKLLDNPDLSQDKRAELELQIKIDKTNLRNIKKKNVYAEAILGSPKFVKGFVGTIMTRLREEKKDDGTPKYPDPDNNPNLYDDAFKEFVNYFEDAYAVGGRVGYQGGNAVMPTAGPIAGSPSIMDRATTDTEVEDAYGVPVSEAVPEELQNIDYDTLRARLPSSITDDIVRLIANSAEAMEDFAMIQTQQDINNFNEKYGVELVLPAEA